MANLLQERAPLGILDQDAGHLPRGIDGRRCQQLRRVGMFVEGHRDEVGLAGVQGSSTPAWRSMAQSAISGSPISEVGSSLSTDSTSVMPKASIFALPAQS